MEENNKIIATFMGWKEHSKHKYPYVENKDRLRKLPPWYSEINHEGNLYDFNYDTDWNWLIPVVEKIENTKIKDYSISTNITDNKTYISVYHYGEGGKWSVLISNLNEEYKNFNKLQRTYKGVIEFINFYNKEMKK